MPDTFGQHMRRLRIERGLSLRELARLALSSKSHLGEFEIGRKTPKYDTACRIDRALDAHGELSGLVAPDRLDRQAMPGAEFSGGMAGMRVGSPALLSLGAGHGVGADLPEQLLARTARLRRIDDFVGGSDTAAMYAAEAEATIRVVRDGVCPEPTRRALLAVFAEQAQLAGWAAFDAGRHPEAERQYRLSLSAAEDAGARPLAGNALSFLAYQRTTVGLSGTDAAAASVATAGPAATPKVRVLLHERRAWTFAMDGDADGTARCLDAAEAAFSDDARCAEPDWVYWVDRTEMQVMTGRCWSVLGRPLRAIAALEAALAGYDDTHARDKALYLTWLVQAYADAGEPEQACAVANRVVDLASGVNSMRPLQRIRLLMPSLARHDVPEVVSLCGRVDDWVDSVRSQISAPT